MDGSEQGDKVVLRGGLLEVLSRTRVQRIELTCIEHLVELCDRVLGALGIDRGRASYEEYDGCVECAHKALTFAFTGRVGGGVAARESGPVQCAVRWHVVA